MSSSSAVGTLTRVVVATHPGVVRNENQDQFCVDGLVSGGTSMPARSIPVADRFHVAVIDGMGGHAGGKDAARIVAETLAEPMAGWDGVVAQLQTANARLHEVMGRNPSLRGMGATVVMLLVDDVGWTVSNIGDARAYLHQGGYSVVVSTDDRSRGGGGAITQSLGGTERPVAVQPHVTTLSVTPGDRLLLCTDGLSDVVSLGQIQSVLEGEPVLTTAADRLVDAALDAGAPDNVTVALIEVAAGGSTTGAKAASGSVGG